MPDGSAGPDGWTARHGTKVLLWGCCGQLAGLIAFGVVA